MKNFKILLLCFTLILGLKIANSQEIKSVLGFGLQMQANSDLDHQKDIPVDNSKRFSGAGTIDYQKFLKNNWTYSISLEYNSRTSYLPANKRASSQLFQSYLALPIGFGWSERLNRENKNAVKQHITSYMVGGYVESIMQQGIADSSQVYFELKDKYFNYCRFGIYLDANISILPKTSGYSGHTFGFQARWNPKGADFGDSKSVIQQSGYAVVAVYYRYLLGVKFSE